MKLKKFVSDNGGVTRDFHQIDPRLLQVRPNFNIRDLTTPAAREKLDILKAQIKAEGVLEPLEIEFDGETPWINEGHRRHIVVMELIEEGHDFKTIPCVQERQNIKDDKRTLHMLMRRKEEYEPLEYAKGLQRMVDVYGWDRAALATSLGEPKATIDRHLAMLGMTEEVQDQVAQGIVSATVALKVTRDTRDAKTDPAFAAEIIRAAAEEKKRLGKKGRATPKAIARATERAKPKSEPKAEPEKAGTSPQTILPDELHETQTQPHSPLSDEAAAGPAHEVVHEQLQVAAERERPVREFPAEALQAPTSNRDFDREMLAILGRIAEFAEGFDLNNADNGETLRCDFPIGILRDADRAYRSRIGDDTAEAA